MSIFATMDPSPSTRVGFDAITLPYRDTGAFSDLILHYLEGKEGLRPFYHRFPRPAEFAVQATEKAAHYTHRATLIDALKGQYAAAKLKCPALDKLAHDNAYTITTGHQVCLFTGPVYFIYKIATAVKACRMLEQQYPEMQCVPVFWMATEDHDFEEANHFHLPGKKLEWESGQGGAVGRMRTEGLEEVMQQLKAEFGIGYHAAGLQELYEKAYLRHGTVAAATRAMVHALFGAYGVVCVDGDDAKLKRLAIPAFKKELLEHTAESAVNDTSERLSSQYKVQAHPRAINLFYLGDQFRERIVADEEGGYKVLNTTMQFNREAMLEALEEHPERFSPNVILRPLYQEIILPNLAYIGGGGELAYWFQLKDMFAAFEQPFPILMLRNSAMIAGAREAGLMQQLDIGAEELFAPALELEAALLKRESKLSLELDAARDELEQLYSKVEEKLAAADPTLRKSARSAHQRSDRLLAVLEKKLLRAEKRKQEVLVDRLHQLRDFLFPGGGLQERKWNFSVFYAAYGPEFIEALIEHFDPFAQAFTVLTEQPQD